MRLRALIFDVDGTLADTERYGHFPASNDALAALNYPIHWTWETYKWLVENLPGAEWRMRHALAQHDPNLPEAELDHASRELADLKRQIYLEKYASQIPLRPGIEKLVNEAIEKNILLAIVTLSHEAQVRALLTAQLPHALDHFQPLLGKMAGRKTATDSPLYRRCVAELGTSPADTLVIEDSAGGLKAALTAGLRCAVFYNNDTFDHTFTGASLVARSCEFFDLELLSDLCLAG